jgi:hypothetical protein
MRTRAARSKQFNPSLTFPSLAYLARQRFARKSDSHLNRYHLENPYWQTFDKYVIPLLAKDMDLRRLNELDASKEVRVEKDAGLWEQVKKHQTY